MDPLSPFTYYRRHKGQALLLLGMIAALTLGVFMAFGLTNIMGETAYYPLHYLTRLSHISAGGASDTTMATIAGQAGINPDVAVVLPENGLQVNVPSVIGMLSFPLLGVTETDLPVVMDACDLRLKMGRLIQPHAGEVILSEEIARTLDLQVGDPIGYTISRERYPTIVTELTLVGILESVPSTGSGRRPSTTFGTGPSTALGTGPSTGSGQVSTGAAPDAQVGFVAYEYLDSHELYQPRSPNLLVIPRPGSRTAMNDALEQIVEQSAESTSVHVATFERESAALRLFQQSFNLMYGLGDVLIAAAAALVVGMVNRIAVMHRLPEFGLLHAAGYAKARIARLLALEMAVVACVGWVAGLLGACALSLLLNAAFFAARGTAINLTTLLPLLFTLPIPLLIIAWVGVDVSHVLKRLDAVSIIERGNLSVEEGQRKQAAKRSSSNPLSSATFYRRHPRQGIMVTAAVGLMVFSVALPAFIISTSTDAVIPYLFSYSSRVSIVAPGARYRAIDPGVLAQIRAYPDVAHVIPARALNMAVDIPTLGELPTTIYAVREQDLALLLDVYGLYLSDGALLQPRSNQMLLTTALARNRQLAVGDIVVRPARAQNGMPTEMYVAGLLASDRPALAEHERYKLPPASLWAGFASYEYVDSHERYAAAPLHELIVPLAGREASLETWLEQNIASPRTTVTTFGVNYRTHREGERSGLRMITLTESILVVVAVIGLAVMNTIFFFQRRSEFGILYATGYDRAWLLLRALRESVSVASVAWLVGAALCVAFLFYQANVCARAGLRLDFFNLTPWVLTWPIPLAVVAASVGTIAWMLSRLDPVAVIERR